MSERQAQLQPQEVVIVKNLTELKQYLAILSQCENVQEAVKKLEEARRLKIVQEDALEIFNKLRLFRSRIHKLLTFALGQLVVKLLRGEQTPQACDIAIVETGGEVRIEASLVEPNLLHSPLLAKYVNVPNVQILRLYMYELSRGTGSGQALLRLGILPRSLDMYKMYNYKYGRELQLLKYLIENMAMSNFYTVQVEVTTLDSELARLVEARKRIVTLEADTLVTEARKNLRKICARSRAGTSERTNIETLRAFLQELFYGKMVPQLVFVDHGRYLYYLHIPEHALSEVVTVEDIDKCAYQILERTLVVKISKTSLDKVFALLVEGDLVDGFLNRSTIMEFPQLKNLYIDLVDTLLGLLTLPLIVVTRGDFAMLKRELEGKVHVVDDHVFLCDSENVSTCISVVSRIAKDWRLGLVFTSPLTLQEHEEVLHLLTVLIVQLGRRYFTVTTPEDVTTLLSIVKWSIEQYIDLDSMSRPYSEPIRVLLDVLYRRAVSSLELCKTVLETALAEPATDTIVKIRKLLGKVKPRIVQRDVRLLIVPTFRIVKPTLEILYREEDVKISDSKLERTITVLRELDKA